MCPELYPPKEKIIRTVCAHFLGDWSQCEKLSEIKPSLVYYHLPSRLMPGLAIFYDSHLRVARLKGQRVKELASSIGQSKLIPPSFMYNAFTHMHEILRAPIHNLAMGFVIFLNLSKRTFYFLNLHYFPL